MRRGWKRYQGGSLSNSGDRWLPICRLHRGDFALRENLTPGFDCVVTTWHFQFFLKANCAFSNCIVVEMYCVCVLVNCLIMHMWQSPGRNERYSMASFDCITAFETRYL